MNVKAILKHKGHEIVSVAPVLKLDELARELHARRIGAVLVRDTAGAVLGIVSERDLVGAIARQGSAALELTAAQVMTRDLQTIDIGASVEQAMALMTAGRFRHLPVLDGGVLAGVVSIGDVVKARIDEQDHEVDSLKAYVAGAA